MKKLGLIVLGAGAALAAGSAAYYLYRQYQSGKALSEAQVNEPLAISPPKAGVAEVLTQCLIEGMEVILKYQQFGAQIRNSGDRSAAQLKKGMREKCNADIKVVDSALKVIEDTVCERLGWNVDAYYVEIGRKKELNDPYGWRIA